MASLEINLSENGDLRVIARCETVTDGQAAANLMARVSLSLRLLSETAQGKSEDFSEPLPVGYSTPFVCACGWQGLSSREALRHVEDSHASATIRGDLDALESTIERLITPNPLMPVSDEVFPVKTWDNELTKEIAEILAHDVDKSQDVTLKHGKRAERLMKKNGWSSIRDWNLMDVKRQIIEECKTPAPKSKLIKPRMHEDFLTVCARFVQQVLEADEESSSAAQV